jgi:hypothetical protein
MRDALFNRRFMLILTPVSKNGNTSHHTNLNPLGITPPVRRDVLSPPHRLDSRLGDYNHVKTNSIFRSPIDAWLLTSFLRATRPLSTLSSPILFASDMLIAFQLVVVLFQRLGTRCPPGTILFTNRGKLLKDYLTVSGSPASGTCASEFPPEICFKIPVWYHTEHRVQWVCVGKNYRVH